MVSYLATVRNGLWTSIKANGVTISILAIHLALGVLYSVTVPIWEVYDEWAHYLFIRYIATEWTLSPPQEKLPARLDETHQPPLYHAIGALATFWIDTSDDLKPVSNPYWTPRDGQGGVNVAVHSEEEAFPYRGTVLAIHVARLVSVLIGTVTVWVTYLIGRTVFPRRKELAWGAMAINAFWPQFLFTGSVITNDIMVSMFSSLTLLFLIAIVNHGFQLKRGLGLGLSLIGGFLSKNTALALLPLVLLGAIIGAGKAVRRRGNPARYLRWLPVLLLILGLFGAWLYLPDYLGYPSPQRELVRSFIRLLLNPPTVGRELHWEYLPEILDFFFRSFWASFGWGTVSVEQWIYQAVTILYCVAACSLLVYLIRGPELALKLIVSLWISHILLSVGLAGYKALVVGNIWEMPGRYALGAISSVSLLLSLGLASLVPRRFSPFPVLVVAGVMLVFSSLVPFRYLIPAYAKPPLLTPAEIQDIPHPLYVNFGHKIELVGYDAGARRVQVGQSIPITLYWRCLREMESNYTVAVKVLAADYSYDYGEVDVYPGRGNFATSLWRAGDIFRETYWVPISTGLPAPSLGRIRVALFIDKVYEYQEHLPVLNERGEIVGRSAIFGHIKIRGQREAEPDIPNSVSFSLGGKVALVGYEVDRLALTGAEVGMTLYWRALAEMEETYTVFMHMIDEDGQIVAQGDSQPRDGNYPTDIWDEGEIIADKHVLPLPSHLAEGEYRLMVGMYLLETMQRLPALDANGMRLSDDQILLPGALQVRKASN